jgi:hypothetical protein
MNKSHHSVLEKKMLQKQKRLGKIIKVLNKGYISSEDYNSSEQACFSINCENNFYPDFKPVFGLPESLNNNIIIIYNLLGNPKKELYLGEWTLMSAENALERYKLLCEDNRKDVFDIGHTYIGMGHVRMLSCDLNNHLLFYRPDGGSSGYDREDNYNNLINYGSKDYRKFYFTEWLDSIIFEDSQ